MSLLNKSGYKCTQSMIAQIETGKISNPSQIFLRALAKVLNLDFDVVMLEFVSDKYNWKPKVEGYEKKLVEVRTTVLSWVKTDK